MSTTTTYDVTGMTCGHCAAAVTQEVSQIEGVEDVKVDVESGKVVVTSAAPLAHDDVVAAVDEAGYALKRPGELPVV
ncbi:heavy-metal-associated domain-containing protein [Aeromicrobium sp. 179-A 4D2 NHS]|uniref:heavy-metal-associated domain-containing protein n=1 Tax=Aeromicrobium sp. 179-A 4D2 NHS TaxID=3142375 RepID=UPI0039A0CDAE